MKTILSIDGTPLAEGDIVYTRNSRFYEGPYEVYIHGKGTKGEYWAIKAADGRGGRMAIESISDHPKYGMSRTPFTSNRPQGDE